MFERDGYRGLRGRWMAALVCASVLGSSTPLMAQGTADELARRHFEAGAAYLHASDYENALREFQRAYDLSPRAAILLSIATVHEREGDLDAALDALERYVATDPEGEHVETATLRIENLRKRQAARSADAGTAPTAPDAATTDAGAPEPAAAESAPPTEPEPPLQPATRSEANVPAYVLLGIGGVSALAAGITGLMADKEWHDAQDTCSPRCTDDELSTGRAMAVTSTILTGVALVGIGVGAALLLLVDTDEAPPTAGGAPEVQIGFGPHGAGANAKWRF